MRLLSRLLASSLLLCTTVAARRASPMLELRGGNQQILAKTVATATLGAGAVLLVAPEVVTDNSRIETTPYSSTLLSHAGSFVLSAAVLCSSMLWKNCDIYTAVQVASLFGFGYTALALQKGTVASKVGWVACGIHLVTFFAMDLGQADLALFLASCLWIAMAAALVLAPTYILEALKMTPKYSTPKTTTRRKNWRSKKERVVVQVPSSSSSDARLMQNVGVAILSGAILLSTQPRSIWTFWGVFIGLQVDLLAWPYLQAFMGKLSTTVARRTKLLKRK